MSEPFPRVNKKFAQTEEERYFQVEEPVHCMARQQESRRKGHSAVGEAEVKGTWA